MIQLCRWEETIILLPDNVHYVFLSATIPNALQFAQWICSVHSQVCCDPALAHFLPLLEFQPCHVVYTNYRPTPLQHYIFPQGGDGLHLVVDEKGMATHSVAQSTPDWCGCRRVSRRQLYESHDDLGRRISRQQEQSPRCVWNDSVLICAHSPLSRSQAKRSRMASRE